METMLRRGITKDEGKKRKDKWRMFGSFFGPLKTKPTCRREAILSRKVLTTENEFYT